MEQYHRASDFYPRVDMMQSEDMETKSKIVNLWTQSIAILLAGIWSLYQFVYIEKYKPTQEKPSLEIEISMEKVGDIAPKNSSKSLQAYRAIITTKNFGKSKAYVASGYFKIYADEIIKKPDNYQLKREQVEEIINLENQLISKTFKPVNSELIVTGTVYSSLTWFNPGQTISTERLFYLPDEQYSQIEANVFILSGQNTTGIKVRHIVNNTFDFAWEVSDESQIWYSIGSPEGKKLTSDRLTITSTNKYIPIIRINASTSNASK